MDFLKHYYLKKRIRENLKSLELYQSAYEGTIDKVGCLVDMEEISDVKKLLQLVKDFGVRSEGIVFLGYRKKSDNTHIDGTPFLIDADINWQGRVRNYHADRLAEQEYDLLINYFSEPKLPLLLVSSSVKAKLRVGLKGIDNQYNDIIIDCSLGQEAVFSSELKKILQTLKQ